MELGGTGSALGKNARGSRSLRGLSRVARQSESRVLASRSGRVRKLRRSTRNLGGRVKNVGTYRNLNFPTEWTHKVNIQTRARRLLCPLLQCAVRAAHDTLTARVAHRSRIPAIDCAPCPESRAHRVRTSHALLVLAASPQSYTRLSIRSVPCVHSPWPAIPLT